VKLILQKPKKPLMVSEKDKREEKLLKAIFLSKEIFQMMDN
jgi:hypothetical protein